MTEFGKINPLDVRSIWASEPYDFTPWLAQNLDKLGEALGLELELIEQEADVGDFALDILARDLGTGRNVVIENQFGATNHDHLGKLLTYSAGLDASTIILIAEKIRDEHRQTLEWLNQKTDSTTDFFAVTLEVFQIDDSKPAFKLNPIVFPNEWQKGQKGQKTSSPQSTSAKSEGYRKFFQLLIDELRDKYRFTGAKVAQPQSWYAFSAGTSGIQWVASFPQGGKFRIELYIDLGDSVENKKLFDWLIHDKDQIEQECGDSIQWERLDEKRASRIAIYRSGNIDAREDVLAEIQRWAIEKLLMFKKVFKNRLDTYKITM